MSHITTVAVEIRDLEAVKALCREKGWTFKEGKKTCVFYKGQEHSCDHAIGFPGQMAEVGLVRSEKGGYSMAFDPMYFGPYQGQVEGVGKDGKEFMQGYGVAKAELEARKRGLNVRRVAGKNGAVKLVLTGAAL